MDFSKLAREEILEVKPYIPGKPVEELQRERGLTDVIKLASNENPHGPGPAVLEVLEKGCRELNRYPDDCVFYLRRALAEHLGVGENRIFIGAGSVEILYLLAYTFAKRGENLIYSNPCFVAYPIISKLSLGTGVAVPGDEVFRHDLEAMAEAVNDRTKLVFIANPDNPTGTYKNSDDLERFMESVPQDVLVAVDEAYYEYVDAPDYPETIKWLERYPNLIILHTFSKIYSLAGLRVGYSISHPDLAAFLDRARAPFNVNSLSQIAALTALKETERVARIREENSTGRQYVTDKLRGMGCRVLDSQTNFVMAFLPVDAGEAYDALLDKGVIVRPMGSFGTEENAVRISIGLEEENNRLLQAMNELLKGLPLDTQ